MSSLYPFSNNAAKVLQIFDYAKTFPKEFMIIIEKTRRAHPFGCLGGYYKGKCRRGKRYGLLARNIAISESNRSMMSSR